MPLTEPNLAMTGSDLSDYEKIRLANINRNAEFLRGLGLNVQKDNGVAGFQPAVKAKVKEVVRVRKPRSVSR